MSFAHFKTFTTDHAQCGAADVSNFPVLLRVTDADLKTVGNGGYVQSSRGFDIRPFSDAAFSAALTFQLVKYDAATGLLEMYVSLPTLTHATDVVSYLAFGDAGVTTDGSSRSVWDSNFLSVRHFTDPTSGATLLTDSSQNGPDSTDNHGATGNSGGQIN